MRLLRGAQRQSPGQSPIGEKETSSLRTGDNSSWGEVQGKTAARGGRESRQRTKNKLKKAAQQGKRAPLEYEITVEKKIGKFRP